MRKVCAVFLASLMVYLSGCGGGGGDDGGGGSAPVQEQPEPAVSPLSVEVVTPVQPGGIPEVSISGDRASITYRVETDGTILEASYRSAAPAAAARVFFDPDTGLPRTILDEISGRWMSIRSYGESRVDYWIYDAVGNFQDGFGIFEEDGDYYWGDVVGIPARGGDVADGLNNIRRLTADEALVVDSIATHFVSPVSEDFPVVAGLGQYLFWGGAIGAVAFGGVPALAGLATAMGVVAVVGVFTPDIQLIITGAARKIGCTQFEEGWCYLAGSHLADPGTRGPIGYLIDGVNWLLGDDEEDISEEIDKGEEATKGAQVYTRASLTDDLAMEPFSSDRPFAPASVPDTSDTDSDDTPTVELVAPPTISK